MAEGTQRPCGKDSQWMGLRGWDWQDEADCLKSISMSVRLMYQAQDHVKRRIVYHSHSLSKLSCKSLVLWYCSTSCHELSWSLHARLAPRSFELLQCWY